MTAPEEGKRLVERLTKRCSIPSLAEYLLRFRL